MNGKKINPFKNYTVAFTEGIIRGAEGVSKYTTSILRFPKKSPYRIWESIEEKLLSQASTSQLRNINDENRTFYMPDVELPKSE